MTDAELARLAALRRLYRHLCSGGTITPADERRYGIKPMTKHTLSAEISRLEAQCE